MSKKVISKRVETRASKVVRDSRAAKSAAGSILTQREKKVPARVRRGVDIAIRLYRDALKELEKY